MNKVTEDSYPHAMNALTGFCRTLVGAADKVDLTEMRTICGRFQTLGPALGPIARCSGELSLRDQAAFLKALDEFVTELRKLDHREEHADA